MATSSERTALISGASIAGPTLAYWLHRYGFDVTLVERSSTVRTGGYPIDVRGVAATVIERMDMLPELRASHIATQRFTFVDAAGKTLQTLDPKTVVGNEISTDLELPRGQLASALFEITHENVEYRFDDSIVSLVDQDNGIQVQFAAGPPRRFDVVLGADGLHSNVRQLAFGPESQFERYLGWSFVTFTMQNHLDLANEGVIYNTPGRMATIYAVGDAPETVYGHLSLACPHPAPDEIRDVRAMRRKIREAFAGARWEIPRMLTAMEEADDLFCDTVSQIRMPSWSTGRVALTGDAAFAPTLLSGQGTSLALVGSYILAGQLGCGDHRSAFQTYESLARGFIERNQALAPGRGIAINTRKELWLRNQFFRLLPILDRLGLMRRMGNDVARAATALTLPDYPLPV